MGYLELAENFIKRKESNKVNQALAREWDNVSGKYKKRNVGVRTEVVEITPELAREWLRKVKRNRNVTKSVVKKYAKDMSNGDWILTGESLKFSIDGFLIDGQHRLEAVIEADTTILCCVTWGIRDERAFVRMDTGRKRTPDQLVEIAFREEIDGGLRNSKVITSVARRVLLWEIIANKHEYSLSNSLFSDISGQAIIDYLRIGHNLTEIQWLLGDLKPSMPYKRSGAGSSLVAAMVILHKHNHPVTMDFMNRLIYGADLKKNSPVILLRDKLMLSTERNRSRMWATEVMALTIKAWNKFAKGETVKSLSWRWDGNAPEKFPIPRSGV